MATHWMNIHAGGGVPSPSIPTTSASASASASSTVIAPATPAAGHGGGYGLGAVFLAGLAGLAAGAGALWYGVRDRLSRSAASANPAGQAAAAWENEGRGRAWNTAAQPADGDRDQLVGALIDLADRLRDSDRTGLWKTANRHLEAVGVRVHTADGQRFDPAQHQAGGYTPTEVPENHLTVASTEECGYTDRGKVIRRPRVIVYRAPGDSRVR